MSVYVNDSADQSWPCSGVTICNQTIETSPDDRWLEDLCVKLATQISASLSIAGSLIIFGVYFCMKHDTKSTARPLVVSLTVVDLLNAAGNLYGISVDYGGESTWDCVAQSFLTTYASISSFFWTTSLSIYLYIAIVRIDLMQANSIVPICHIINWLLPLAITLAAFGMSALGNDEGAGCGSAGWCWIRKDVPNRTFWMISTGKLWEISAAVILPVAYFLTKQHLFRQHRRMTGRRLRDMERKKLETVVCVNRRFMAIPVLFVFLRMWGTIRTLLDFMDACNATSWFGLRIFHGFGDSFQGSVNCIVYCLMSERGQRYCSGLFNLHCGGGGAANERSLNENNISPSLRRVVAGDCRLIAVDGDERQDDAGLREQRTESVSVSNNDSGPKAKSVAFSC